MFKLEDDPVYLSEGELRFLLSCVCDYEELKTLVLSYHSCLRS